MMSLKVRTFYIFRHEDVNGLSGVGIVAVGVVWPNGKAHMQWTSFRASFEIHESIDNLMEIHGHSGKTELIWGDPPCDDDKVKKPRKKKKDESQKG
jgi:hypothetical protein